GTDFFYDPQGREIRKILPSESWTDATAMPPIRRETATQRLPFVSRELDEEDLRSGSPQEGTPHVEHLDGLGRVVAVEEFVKLTDTGLPGPLISWRTEYAYDLNDQVTRIKDSQGNVKSMSYDGLKRMLRMDDPDRGVLTFTYDDASNLKQTVDAKGQKVV